MENGHYPSPDANAYHNGGNLEPKEEEHDAEILDRRHFRTTFSSTTYLHDFYAENTKEAAMQIVLTFLPKIVARLEQRVEDGEARLEKLLDFGAGPTIHVAVCFRKLVKEVEWNF